MLANAALPSRCAEHRVEGQKFTAEALLDSLASVPGLKATHPFLPKAR
jgi:hypothetical protein